MSTNADCIPGSTRVTRPLWMLPASEYSLARWKYTSTKLIVIQYGHAGLVPIGRDHHFLTHHQPPCAISSRKPGLTRADWGGGDLSGCAAGPPRKWSFPHTLPRCETPASAANRRFGTACWNRRASLPQPSVRRSRNLVYRNSPMAPAPQRHAGPFIKLVNLPCAGAGRCSPAPAS